MTAMNPNLFVPDAAKTASRGPSPLITNSNHSFQGQPKSIETL
jgi:hypothetical protein